MPKSRPRFVDTKYRDFFIKWMSKINSIAYRRGGGEGLGSTFQTDRVIPLVVCEP